MAKKVHKKKRGAPKKRRTAKKKAVRKKKVARKKPAARKPAPELPAEPLGRVTHYFPKARATAILIERDGIRIGDSLYFKGHTTAFKQRVQSLQIDHKPVSQASPEEEVGIQVRSRTREHDLVFKL